MNDKLDDVTSCGYKGGLFKENYKNGFEIHEWNNVLQKYCGNFYQNNLHNEGYYSNTKSNKSYLYEGSLYAGNFNGYARVTQSDCTYFEGLFKDNKRYGPGVLTDINGLQDVGIWDGLNLIRLGITVLPEWVPKLATTGGGKVKLLKYRKLVSLNDDINYGLKIMQKITNDEELLKKSYKLFNLNIQNDKSLCFDKPSYDLNYFGDENYCYIDVPIEPEEIFDNSSINTNELDVDELLCFILNNMERFKTLTPQENELIEIKHRILKILSNQDIKKIKNYDNIKTKKVELTNILTWNNDEDLIDILKHTFKHKNRENIVRFGISDILAGKRNVFSEPSNYERACSSFLLNCSEGNEVNAVNLFYEFKLNPDLSDAAGNSAVMFASARDHLGLIRELTQLGANLDKVNDENLTPLSMVLLRYIATLKGIKNWESAFLGLNNNINTLNNFNNILINDEPYSNDELNLKNNDIYYFNGLRTEETDLQWLYDKLGLEKPSLDIQKFQEPYNTNNEITEYIFENKLIKTKSPKKQIKKGGEAKISDDLLKKLDVIYNTIVTLLYYGADGNIGEVPLPVLNISLYTENAKILIKLIESGVNINLTSDEGLTALHTLLTLPLKEYLVSFCEILLKNGADPNLRTPIDHWEDEKLIVQSNYPEISPDIGKTGLNIIGLRQDFNTDDTNVLGKLAELFVRFGANVDDKYLGHTTLSLAVLKGNTKLVEDLLKSGANPNEILENNLGTPFTIYSLNRYTKIKPNQQVCENILKLLIQFFANPLNEIYGFGNAYEFAMNEKTKVISDKKGKNVSGKKSKKGDIKSDVTTIMLDHVRNTALKHQTFKAVMVLINAVIKDINVFNEDDSYKDLVKVIKSSDAVNAVQILLDFNYLNYEYHDNIINLVLNYINKNGFSADMKNIDLQQNTNKLEIHKNCYNIELDKEDIKYTICFYCGLRTGKILLPCPKCGLIYYCSQECNSLGNKLKTQHNCNILFYNEERKKYDECVAKNIPYCPQNHLQKSHNLFHDLKKQAKKLRSSVEFLESENKGKQKGREAKYTVRRKTSEDTKEFHTKTRDVHSESMDTKKRGSKGIPAKSIKRSIKSDKTRAKSGETSTKSGENRAESDKTSAKSTQTIAKSTQTSSKSDKTDKSTKKAGKVKTSSVKSNKLVSKSAKTDSGSSKTKSKKSRSNSGKIGKELGFKKDHSKSQKGKLIKDKSKSSDKTKINRKGLHETVEKFNKYKDKNKFLSKGENFVGAKYVHDKKTPNIVSLSPQQKAFIQKLALLFPELDFTTLFLPFVCFKEGQFYYRFTDMHPFFCATYTGV